MNTSRTLEQLEGNPWPPPPSDASSMVQRCHALRKVPVAKLAAGDCRLLIGQDIGTKHLVPLALTFVEAEPLLEGDYYPGDLLLSLFRVPKEYWAQHRDHHVRLLEAARGASKKLGQLEDPLGSEQKLLKEIEAYVAGSDA